MLGLWTANKHMMNAEQMKLVRKMEVLVSWVERKCHKNCSVKYVQF